MIFPRPRTIHVIASAVCFLLFFFTPGLAQVVINEIQSSNQTTIADEDGDFEDWIELYNAGPDSADISFFGLSDDYNRPFRWTLPEGTVIEPGGFLLVWASGKDRRTTGQPLHTNFSIAQTGEEILFTHFQTNARVDEIPPAQIPSDKSLGRYPDGADSLVIFREPSPGQSNSEGSPSPFPDGVSFSAPGGFHAGPIDLELSAGRDDVEIRYTLDGSVPTAQSTLYTGPIRIDDRTSEPNNLSTILEISHNYANAAPPAGNVFKGTVVRATAFARGERSDVATRTFFIHPDAGQRFTLPVISLTAHRDSLFGYERGIYALGRVWDEGGQSNALGAAANYTQRGDDWERPAHMEMYETDGSMAVSQDIGLRLHGGASRAFPQKSFRLYSRSDYGTSRFRHRFFPGLDLDDFNRLILRQSGQDVVMTLFRDAYIQETVKHLRFPTQSTRAVIVFLNGEYWGIYNIRERYDIHFIETRYGIDREQVDLMTSDHSGIHLKDGSRLHYDDMLSYIRNNDPADEAHFAQIQTMMDTGNFMDYYIAQIYARNTDWPHNNSDYFRHRTAFNSDAAIPEQDGRWRWMMFDMDFSFGWQPGPGGWAPHPQNDWSLSRHFDRKSYTQDMFQHLDGYPGTDRAWAAEIYHRLMRNETYRWNFFTRFADLLNTTFRPERMTAVLDSMQAIYAPEIEEHIIRWNKTEPDNWNFYWRPFITFEEWEGDVQVMRRYVQERHQYQWDHLGLHAGRGSRQITINVSDPGHGHVRINSIAIHPDTEGVDDDPWPWTGRYLITTESTLIPKPEPGYVFRRWLSVDNGDTLVHSTDEVLTYVHSRSDIHLVAEFRDISVDADGDPDDHPDVPRTFRVEQNYPNPFNNQTAIPYQLPEDARVFLEVYGVDGRLVRRADAGHRQAGSHVLRFDATGLASGVYIGRIRAEGGLGHTVGSASVRMVLIR
jgi:hypothetical protein